jgi:hypothetical protein
VISCSREVNASGIENVLLIIVFLRNPNPWAAVYDVPHTKDVMAIPKTRFLPPRAMAIDARVRCLRRVLLAIWPVSRRAISTRIFRRSPNHQDFGPFPPEYLRLWHLHSARKLDGPLGVEFAATVLVICSGIAPYRGAGSPCLSKGSSSFPFFGLTRCTPPQARQMTAS